MRKSLSTESEAALDLAVAFSLILPIAVACIGIYTALTPFDLTVNVYKSTF